MKAKRYAQLLLALVLTSGASAVSAQNVKITPLGSHTGEFCDRDRATIFEDPTGLHSEMRTVVHDFHKANLAVLNLGQNAMPPEAAAYAVNELIQPVTVIASHPNEAVTAGGKLRPNTRAKKFIDQVKGRPVHLSISGRTMEFDGNAKCVAGC